MEFITGAMGTLLPKLGHLLQEEYNLGNDVKKGIRDLKAELERMEAAMAKLSNVPLDQLDPQVKIWANEVRELSYAIEDNLDSSMVCIEDLTAIKSNTIKGFMKKARDKLTKLKVRHRISNDIKDIEIQVRKVKERYDRYKVDDVVANLAPTKIDPRLRALYNKASDLIGIDKAMEELIEGLSESNDVSEKKLQTVAIVGFGGLGKTTLAKAVYDKIMKNFDCASFVPVGQDPDIKKVLGDILLELDKQMCNATPRLDERQLINQLRKFLANKRYLIVIDDIWDMPTSETIKCALVDNNLGSRIIITTRITAVAQNIGVVYNMRPLSDDSSKELFYKRICGSEGMSHDHQSAEISDRLLRKCGGVPLSIITIASLLVVKRTEDWSKVYGCIGFGHEENTVVENTRKILSFSYYDLPACLKNCLLHLSIFREDQFIEKNQLIWLWIAEGFIPDKQGSRLFELGESFFNELINRSMIQLVQNHDGFILDACRVHDMVLDLIRTLSSQINFVTVLDTKQNMLSAAPSRNNNTIRRLALHKTSIENNPSIEMGHVRSFIAAWSVETRMPSLSSFKVLRVLVLECCDFSVGGCHLEHIGKLVQLRYLGLVGTVVDGLPREIGHDLKFLRTLDVRGSGLEELPSSVGLMRQLMCLRATNITTMTCSLEKLTSLEELELYSVDKSPNFALELGKMTKMRVLEIHFDIMDNSTETTMSESLSNLGKLQSLEISCEEKLIVPFCVWEDCAPPSELRKLLLSGMTLPKRPSWMNSSCVPQLSYLWFSVEVVEDLDLHTLGMLPLLRYLYLFVNEEAEEEENKKKRDEEEEEEREKINYQSSSYAVSRDKFQMLRHLITNIEITCEDGALPMLEELECRATMGKYEDVGLVPGNMSSLKCATYRLDCSGYSCKEVKEAVAVLMHTAEAHPSRPALKIVKYNYDFLRDYIAGSYHAKHGASPLTEHQIETQITLVKYIGLKDSPPVKLSTQKYEQLGLRRFMTLVENSFHDFGSRKKQALEALKMSIDLGEDEETLYGLPVNKMTSWAPSQP